MNYWWPWFQMDEQINKWHTVNEWLTVEKTTTMKGLFQLWIKGRQIVNY